MNENSKTLRTIAYVFNIISTVVTAIFLIPLFWTIPMTIASKKIIDSNEAHIGFGVCCLIFLNTIAGILILVSGMSAPAVRPIDDSAVSLD